MCATVKARILLTVSAERRRGNFSRRVAAANAAAGADEVEQVAAAGDDADAIAEPAGSHQSDAELPGERFQV